MTTASCARPFDEHDELAVNTLRMLAVDAVEQAKSGHPGLPLGAAPLAYGIYSRHLRFDGKAPLWPDRDRFILSAGHGSALLYAVLHMFGYDLPLSEIKRFRQWGSRTPGHPEHGLTPGVEATTGPLGQGFAMGVGMALAERRLAAEFNRPGHEIVNHHTYALVSDGDLMEGVALEAASLAGHLRLGKLIYLYDDNRITIEGGTDLAFTEDVARRFEGMGWQAITLSDGFTPAQLDAAIAAAKADESRPSLILCRTHIGYGSPKADSEKSHGEPLGEKALAATRAFFGWPEERFFVPSAAKAHCARLVEDRAATHADWEQRFAAYRKAHPDLAAAFMARMAGELPANWEAALPSFEPGKADMATRDASGLVLNALADAIPALIGGSADLGPSNKTDLKKYPERTLHFGVREHAMGAVVNGMMLHGGFRAFGATFFVFTDFMRPSIRMAALQELGSIFVLTHDSLGVGEDGPTHQPIEHLAALRCIPNLVTMRPAGARETVAAWSEALKRTHGPTALVLTRQKVADIPSSLSDDQVRAGVARGGYVVAEAEGGAPELILMGTGSEVELCLSARLRLMEKGLRVRVVSLPSWERFFAQPAEYREEVLPPNVRRRLAVEAGSTFGWSRMVGDNGAVLGIDRFGASAPGAEVLTRFGFNVDEVVKRALDLVEGQSRE